MSDGKSLFLPLDGPVYEREFADLMSVFSFSDPGYRGSAKSSVFKVGVAVSGGADSMALCLLLNEWLKAQDGELIAVTVDHSLRPESGLEAKWVHTRLASEGIEHHILNWQKEPEARGSTQVQARNGRYRLMSKWCKENAISSLALAHHHDDQIETFLMRVLRNSGPDGLAGMSLQRQEGGLSFIRPLLSIAKDRLLLTLRDRGWGWIEEPSNHQGTYLRNRLRQCMPDLERKGLKMGVLSRINYSLGRIRRSLQDKTDNFINQRIVVHPAGYAEIDFSESALISPEILSRALERTLLTIGGGNYSPRSVKTDRLIRELLSRETVKATLAGCQIFLDHDKVMIARENRKLSTVVLSSGAQFLWDNRFFIHIHETLEDEGLLLKSLGERGWQQLCQVYPQIKDVPIPNLARYSLPTIFLGDKIITVPHLEYLEAAWMEKLRIKMRFEPKNMLIQHPFTVA